MTLDNDKPDEPDKDAHRLVESDHRCAGVITKFNRSKEQFDALLLEIDGFFNDDPKPHGSVGEFDTKAWEWVEKFKIHEEPPLRLGVMMGEVVHNLRSALDHLMWQVTLLDSGTPDRNTQYPIVTESESKFNKLAARMIPGLSADHRAAVERTQPYRTGDPKRQSLAVLNRLSNVDKHQVVHTAYSCTTESYQAEIDEFMDALPPDAPIRGVLMPAPGQSLQDGTPIMRVLFRPDAEAPAEVKMGFHFTMGVAFGNPGIVSDDVNRMAEDVLGIIHRFMADFPETVFKD